MMLAFLLCIVSFLLFLFAFAYFANRNFRQSVEAAKYEMLECERRYNSSIHR